MFRVSDTMEQLQQQVQAMHQQLQQTTVENQNLNQRLGDMAAQQQASMQAAQHAQHAQLAPDLLQRLVASQEQLANAMRGNRTKNLVDTKGLGKPLTFRNKEEEFRTWSRKTANYICSVHKEATDVLVSVAQNEAPSQMDQLKAEFFELGDDLLDEINAQVFQCLMALTEGESFDLVLGAGNGQGFEAWRRLQRRWDPSTAGRARSLLREILSPGRAKLADLQGAIERLEDMMRRYCSRKDSSGSIATIPEDIRMAALESLCPEDLEKHTK